MQEQLGKDEAAVQKAAGRLPLHKTSAVEFLSMGLELEELQYVAIHFDRAGVVYSHEQQT